MSQNIAVWGAGASGKHLAALIGEDNNITVVDSNPNIIERIRNNGGIEFSYKGQPETQITKIDEALTPDQAGMKGFATVIGAIPAYSRTVETAKQIADSMKEGGVYIDLSNGAKDLDEKDEFKLALEKEGVKYVSGVINFPSKSNPEKLNAVTGLNNAAAVEKFGISIAADSGLADKAIRKLKTPIELSGVSVNSTLNHKEMVVEKMFSIIMMGPLAGLGTDFAASADENTLSGKLARSAAQELYKVGEALGADYSQIAKKMGANSASFEDIWERMKSGLEAKGASKGSLQMAILGGNKTENEAIYGNLISLAEQSSVEVPYIRQIHKMTELMEQQGLADKPSVPGLQKRLGAQIQTEEDFLKKDFSEVNVIGGRPAGFDRK